MSVYPMIAIGVDKGDGTDAAAFTLLRDEAEKAIKSPDIHIALINGKPKSYATISYNKSGNFTIGGQEKVVANYKRSPEYWEDHCIRLPIIKDDSGEVTYIDKTYKDVMGDAFSKIIESVTTHEDNTIRYPDYVCKTVNGKKVLDKSKVVLFVGCPSDKTWSSKKNRMAYEELIRKSTGIENVVVIPESTAGIFSAVSTNKGVDPQKGILVCDFGSSTADHTYVLFGKVLLEISRTLGAKSIETNLDRIILTRKLGEGWRFKVSNADESDRIFQYRDPKERYYGIDNEKGVEEDSAKEPPTRVVKYTPLDENSNPGSTVYMEAEISKELMYEAVNVTPVYNVRENGVDVQDNEVSWSENCRLFFERCKNIIDSNGLPYSAIVLTGGATRMNFIRRICAEVFKGKIIYVDNEPSYCVCKGLCQAAINHYMLQDKLPGYRENVKEYTSELVENYKSDVCSKLASYIFDRAVEACKYIVPGKTTNRMWADKIEELIQNDFETKNKLKELTEGPMNTLMSSLNQKVAEKTGGVNKILYSSELSQNAFSVAPMHIKMEDKFTPKLSSLRLVDTCVHISGLDVLKFLANIVLSILQLPFILLSDFPDTDDDYFKYSNDADRVIKNADRFKKKLEKNKDSVISSLEVVSALDLTNEIMKAQFGEDNELLVRDANAFLEQIVKIIALEYFEKTNKDFSL